MFHKGRFRQEPYEWVYDGLKPLDIVDVVYTNKGISLTLAVTFLGIARHLGIPMSMVPIPEGIAIVLQLGNTACCRCLRTHAYFLQLNSKDLSSHQMTYT